MAFTVTRQQLYDLVWSEAMVGLAKQIGLSDVALAKQCRKHGIPVPKRGYWAKLHAGKSVQRVALPARDLVTVNRITFSGTLGPELRQRIKGEPGEDIGDSDTIDVLTDRLRKRLGAVKVPQGFDTVHPAIASLLKRDEERCRRSGSWYKPALQDAFQRRRLAFLNGLLLGFAKVGAQAWVRGSVEELEHSIHMGDSSVTFQLGKPGVRGRRGADATDVRERLKLSVSHSGPIPGVTMEWEDQDGRPLERQLTEIIVGMAVAGHHLHLRWLEEHARWERQRREEAEREAKRRKEEAERRERERIAALEKERIDGLLRDAGAWRDANTIRAYVAAVRGDARLTLPAADVTRWAVWALAEADRLDPVLSGRVTGSISAGRSETEAAEASGDQA